MSLFEPGRCLIWQRFPVVSGQPALIFGSLKKSCGGQFAAATCHLNNNDDGFIEVRYRYHIRAYYVCNPARVL